MANPAYLNEEEYPDVRLQQIRDRGLFDVNRRNAAEELERRGIASRSSRPEPERVTITAAPPLPAPPPPAPPKPALNMKASPSAAHFGVRFHPPQTCCGSSEFGSFINNSMLDWNNIDEAQLQVLKDMIYERGYTQLHSFTVAELGQGQVMAEKVLPKLGFELVRTFRNRNSGRTVKMWVWVYPDNRVD